MTRKSSIKLFATFFILVAIAVVASLFLNYMIDKDLQATRDYNSSMAIKIGQSLTVNTVFDTNMYYRVDKMEDTGDMQKYYVNTWDSSHKGYYITVKNKKIVAIWAEPYRLY